MSELKPCPFCGGKATIRIRYEREHEFYYCECTKCGAKSSEVYPLRNINFDFNGRDRLIYLWNRRMEK